MRDEIVRPKISIKSLPASDLKTAAPPVTPRFATLNVWMQISGMGRTSVYDAIGLGHLSAIKMGSRLLIDVPAGIAWLESLPKAAIRAPKAKAAA